MRHAVVMWHQRVNRRWSIWALLMLSPLPSQCATPPPEPARVHKDLAFTEFFRRTTGWTAGDGALSVLLADGRVLWLFGDSHIDDWDPATGTIPCLFQARNAGLIHEMNNFEAARTLVGSGPGLRSWLKNSTNETEWFWPLSGFQRGATVYIYLSAMRKTAAGGMWGFENIGHDVWAKIAFPDLKPISYSPLPAFNGITFGMGFVTEGDYTYAFGGKQTGLASDVYVARFRANLPESLWTFWDGQNWSEQATNAAAIARGASTSLHVCKVKNKFLLTTSAFSVACDQGKDIFISTSLRPTGPFSHGKRVFTLDDTFQGHWPFFYFPIAHPEFINAQNELLVTYSINGYEPCVSACVNGRAIPDHYRPKAIRVPLKLIDPDF
jgi:hypothetical protein